MFLNREKTLLKFVISHRETVKHIARKFVNLSPTHHFDSSMQFNSRFTITKKKTWNVIFYQNYHTICSVMCTYIIPSILRTLLTKSKYVNTKQINFLGNSVRKRYFHKSLGNKQTTSIVSNNKWSFLNISSFTSRRIRMARSKIGRRSVIT